MPWRSWPRRDRRATRPPTRRTAPRGESSLRRDPAFAWPRQDPDGDGVVRLHGTKPWCSLAGSLSHALVTAWESETTRRLYAVPLGQANGVTVHPAAWFARGLSAVASGPVTFDGAEAVPVGPAGWYLERPGFAWGAMGVAAIWYGGAVGVARRLLRRWA